MTDNEYCSQKYPTLTLKPKAETGVLNFLQKYPQFNGEGVTIAILGNFLIKLKFHQLLISIF